MVKSYGKVRVGAGLPQIEEGTYNAQINDINDTENKRYGGEQYVVEWALADLEKEDGSPFTLVQWVNIPDGLDAGELNPDSNLFKLMEAIGCDMEEPDVSPQKWLGKKARIWIENKVVKEGDNAGQVRPRIVKVTSLKKGGPARREEREPVGAGAKAAARPAVDDDEDF
jgi:hypothetical protein